MAHIVVISTPAAILLPSPDKPALFTFIIVPLMKQSGPFWWFFSTGVLCIVEQYD